MVKTAEQIRNFLQYIALQFVAHPDKAQLKIAEMEDGHVRYRLIVDKSDVANLIGRNGFTASAIRNILKAAAIRDNFSASLQIISHEEEAERIAQQA